MNGRFMPAPCCEPVSMFFFRAIPLQYLPRTMKPKNPSFLSIHGVH